MSSNVFNHYAVANYVAGNHKKLDEKKVDRFEALLMSINALFKCRADERLAVYSPYATKPRDSRMCSLLPRCVTRLWSQGAGGRGSEAPCLFSCATPLTMPLFCT